MLVAQNCRMARLAIRELRLERKLSLEEVAFDVGISVSQLSRIERDEREAKASELRRLAEKLDVGVAELFRAPEEVPLVGYVGAGAEAHFYGTADDPDETVPAPDGATPSTVAVEIRGESLGTLFDRWLVFYDDRREPVTQDLMGRLCIVGLADDRVLVKKLRISRTKGLFHLLSNVEEPILDVAVEWAARVKIMVPR